VTVIDLPQRQRPTHGAFKVELFAGKDLAAAQWPSLADGCDWTMYVFQSREFLDVWLDTIGGTGCVEPYLAVVKDDDGRGVFYLPLAIETKFNIRLLRFADYGVADYNAPILAADRPLSRQEFADIWSEILSLLPHFDVIDLKKIASDVAGAFNPLTYLDCTAFAESGHVMMLTGLRDGSEKRLSLTKLRRKLARNHKGLARIGETRFIADPSGAALAHVTERLIALKRQRFLNTQMPDFLAEPGVEQFYRAMMSPARLGNIGRLSALTVDGTVASAHFGFVGQDRFYYIMPAYDPAFGRHRVGYLLLQHLVDLSIEQGFDSFDLGVGDERYKDTWATHRLALHSYERAVTAAGRLYLQMRRVRRFVGSGGVRNAVLNFKLKKTSRPINGPAI
jgi:CelD/BcsL family acetyltransferase involved in cellulose biosynthesis